MWRVKSALSHISGGIVLAAGLFGCEGGGGPPVESASELKLAEGVPSTRFDFESKDLGGWQTVDGRWAIEDMAGAPSGHAVLVQRAVDNTFNVIVAPGGPYTDVDVSVRFKPISGAEDASGGISPRTLADRLRQMEGDGMIQRESFREIPPRVQYTLTAKGAAALPVIEALRNFGDAWLTKAKRECC